MNNKLVGGVLVAALAVVGVNEGIKYTAYQDSGGVWTICNGSTQGVKPGDTATPAECESLLVRELIAHAKPIERIPHKLPDHVVVAWADFCYNIGVPKCQGSTGYKLLRQGRTREACEQILRWRFVAGRDCFLDENRSFCGGIKNRRQLEYKLCTGQVTIDEVIGGLATAPATP